MINDSKVHEKLSNLLYKDILEQITEDEKHELESLSVKYNLKGLEREKIIAHLQEKSPFDGYKAFQKSGIKKRPLFERRLIWGGISIAVSVLLWFTAGIWQEMNGPVRDSQMDANMISQGHRSAIVTMGNGQEIEIERMNQEIEENDGTIIHSESGKLIYTSTSTTSLVTYNTMTIPRGGEYSLVLADGTQVWLNAESKLRYPVSFSSHTREVFLEGEAYFYVTKNERHPFIVHTSMGIVKVLGTRFNVRDYTEEEEVVTTLISGKVVYYSGDKLKDSTILAPEFQVADQKNGTLKVKKVETLVYTGWKEGKYIFEEASLEGIMKTLERWYDIQVIFEESQLRQLHFTGDLERYENINVFLDFIETGGDVKFKIEGKTVRVGKK